MPGQDRAGLARLSARIRGVRPGSVVRRAAFALGLLVLTAVIVWVQGKGYRDSAHPDHPLSFLDSLYYSTVTLTTTGYGDIVPVTSATRLENTLLITPLLITMPLITTTSTATPPCSKRSQ